MNRSCAASAAVLTVLMVLWGGESFADPIAMAAVQHNDSQLVEIIVTVEKRSENLQRIPGDVGCQFRRTTG